MSFHPGWGSEDDAVTHGRSTANRAPTLCRYPDWRMGFLRWGKGQPGVVHLPVLAVEVDLVPAPQQFHQLDGLLESADAIPTVGAECGKFRHPVTQTHPENEVPVADVVQRHRLFRDVHRIVVREQQDAGEQL